MDPITRMVAAGAAGAAGGVEPGLYVEDVFSTFLYTASGSTQAIDNGIDLAGEGGMVWIKNRTNGGSYKNHTIVDSERIGSYGHKSIYPNLTEGQYNPTSVSGTDAVVTTFNSDGFTRGGNTNVANGDNVSWTFRKAPGFFDIQTWTGDGSSSSREIAHNLDSTPGMILVKATSSHQLPNGNPAHWIVWHRENGHPAYSPNNYASFLNRNVQSDPSAAYWQDTAPTSTHFTVGITNNQNNIEYVAYIFAHDDARFGTNADESIIKCGRLSGQGSIDFGFEPQWLMVKPEDSGNWEIYDSMRGFIASNTHSLYPQALKPNLDSTETDANYGFYLESNGVENQTFGSGSRCLYVAIRHPHKPPTAATEVYYQQTGVGPYTSGWPIDLWWSVSNKSNPPGWDMFLQTRMLHGRPYLRSADSTSEILGVDGKFDSNDGVPSPSWNVSDSINWFFRRAPGFFDVVSYKGNGSTQAISHNLAAEPEMIMVKDRTRTEDWQVYHKDLDVAYGNPYDANKLVLRLNEDNHSWNNIEVWNSTSPTSSVFSLGGSSNTNHNGDWYVAYLFASLDGISKVGEYTGTGSNVNVDCGFAAGARFVMIKRHDAAGDWYVWDTSRGIVSGANDPYLLLNSTNPEVTNTNYIDPLNAGFTVTASGQGDINASGGKYIYLAIA